jgi:hypothetical protein
MWITAEGVVRLIWSAGRLENGSIRPVDTIGGEILGDRIAGIPLVRRTDLYCYCTRSEPSHCRAR